jgi:DNA helicase-2/ATP-dependent DNA helicase PcrA
MDRNWSGYQQDIFSFVENGKGNAIVEAVAGSGKTTTIVEALKRVRGSSIFLAFNKSIAEELKARGVNARTFHSLTFGVVKNHLGGQMNADKLRALVQKHFVGNDAYMYSAFCCKLVGLAKQAGIGALIRDTEACWNQIVEYHDMEPDHEEASLPRAIELARHLLDLSNASSDFDFDDMLYIPVKDGLSLPKFDFIFVDEAQDTNAIQRALLMKLFKPKTRMVAVGDPAQAIYGFRGADSNSLDYIARDFKATTLPLSVSYRCGRAIVEYAHHWVKHIEPAPNAHDGLVVNHGGDWKNEIFVAGDLVVCRTTRPILSLAFRLIKARIPAFVMGREIGQGLRALIKKLNANDIPQLIQKLDAWREREIEKALVKQDDAKIEQIQDKADCIMCLLEDSESISDLYNAIDNLFSDKEGAVKLATIHKSKGLEAKRVFWLNRSACPSKWARQKWQKQQEDNICYVATTRAINELHIIEEAA